MDDFGVGTVEEIALALDGVRAGQDAWRCLCPVHGGHSLSVAEGRDGRLLCHCFGAGCSFAEIIAALRGMGLDTGGAPRFHGNFTFGVCDNPEERDRSIAAAGNIYCQARPAAGSPVEVYLRSRGITLAVPETLRFLSQAPHRDHWYYPAMVAAIVEPYGEPLGSHSTYLKPDGSGKHPFPDKAMQRETRGSIRGGAAQLMPCDGPELLVGEGIETVLSAAQLFDLPAWAALSTSGLRGLELPPEIRKVTIAVDNDLNNAGQIAALSLYTRLKDEGRTVRLLMPPIPGSDFNDMLMAGASWL